MKHLYKYARQLLIFSLFMLGQGFSFCVLAQTNEVGDKLFVAEPQAKPIYVSKGGTRYWHCEGMIAPKLIEIIHSELSVISKEEGVPPPMNLPCHYKIGSLEFAGNSIPFYSIDFYVSKESMVTCIEKDFCNNFRSMNFIVKNEKLHRQYMVTNIEKKLTRMACIDMKGKVVSGKAGC
jgi:hypothetical protein